MTSGGGLPAVSIDVKPALIRESRAWILRPIVWFVAASMLTTILHEVAHASTAYALGVPSILYNYSADVDLTHATAYQRALIGIAGPLFCLGWGVLAWLAFRRFRGSAAGLPLLYLSVFGIATFFGNLMSTSFVGDFSAAAITLDVPMEARYLLSAAGGLSVAAIHFWAGRQLVQWVPPNVGRMTGMLGIIVLPVVTGTIFVILVNQPMPAAWATVRFAEAGFWVFAGVAVLVTRRHFQNAREHPGVQWIDAAVILVAAVIVRLMVRGIPFVP